MCHKIESPFVLIHLLKKKSRCTIQEIVTIKRKIEDEIPSVYFDVSKNSILETVFSYPEIFGWEDEYIKRKDNAERFFQNEVMDFFNNANMDKRLELDIVSRIENYG